MKTKSDVYVSLALMTAATPLMMSCQGNGKKEAPKETMQRPNIVWFLDEDISTHFLALYNEGHGAPTPNLDKLAKEGVVYTNAYSNAPVSSAARTTLITGSYAPKFAGSLHRKIKEMPMPEGTHMFPTYFREQGYFTCNAHKTDYNVVLDHEAWDVIKGEMGGWRERPDKNQPFFFQRTNMKTHESCLHFSPKVYATKKTRYNPEETYIHPHLPNTPLMRYTYATLYDRIEDADRELGEMVEMLREDSLLENTFIFFMGDNGGCVPGTKGYTKDIGLHVPLVVYVPQAWRKQLGIKAGSKEEGLVSFMDLAPTIMQLAGIEIPKEMDGKPFMGKHRKPNKDKMVMGYGDRYDELYAFNRVIRQGDFRYERNYQPYHSRSLYAFYRYKQLAFKEWKQLHEEGKLNEAQEEFFQPMGAEGLYDLKHDPNELHNLAHDPQYAEVAKRLRNEMNRYMLDKADIGFFPETVIYEEGMEDPNAYGKQHAKRIERLITIADLQLTDFAQAKEPLKEALQSDDDAVRWWALTTCASFGKRAAELQTWATPLLQDERSYVRARAQVFLSTLGMKMQGKDVIDALQHVRTGVETLMVLNDCTYMVESGKMDPFELTNEDIVQSCTGVDWRVTYLNELNR